MATIKTGLITNEQVLSNELVVDMSERIHRLQEDRTQFTTMLMEISRKEATREVIDWLEEQYTPRTTGLAASATSAATAITVTTGEGNTVLQINDVLRVMETGEGLLVTGVSANSAAVTRTWGGTAAASATSAAKILVVGNAYTQGASSGVNRYTQRVRGYNYVQEIRHPMLTSFIEIGNELYGGREPEKEIVRKGVEHKQSIESTLFWGARDYNSAGVRGSCGGAVEFISTNITSAGGALTPAEMDTFLQGPLGYAEDPVFFCAPTVATVLSQMYRGIWAPRDGGTQKFGVKVNGWIDSTYGGNIPIIVKKEWSDLNATGSNYGTWGFLIDMAKVRLRPFRGWPIGSLRRKIQEPSATAQADEFYSPLSLEFGQQQAHGILKNVTSYSAT